MPLTDLTHRYAGSFAHRVVPEFHSQPAMVRYQPEPRTVRLRCVHHNVVLDAIWLVPGQRDEGGVRWFASGWQIGGIYHVSTGLPFTPLIGGDPLGLKTSYPFDFPDRTSVGNCASAVNPGIR
jgi:hypothetical protein